MLAPVQTTTKPNSPAAQTAVINPRPYIVENGEIVLRFHKNQWRAWDSRKRIVAILAGTQGGKTSFGPAWFFREIQQRGPGDYLVAAPTYPLLGLKTIPEYIRYFQTVTGVARYVGSPTKKLIVSPAGQHMLFGKEYGDETAVYFGHAQDPDSLESMTAKAAHADECGQKKFKLGSYEAIMRRLSINEGRLLITTTPYYLGWLKTKIHDPGLHGSDPTIDLIRFRSIENPAFPRAEWERAQQDLPAWKFDMFYRAIFTRPPGLIYDNFNDERHTCPRFDIPPEWPRYMGQDYGGVNTAAIYIAAKPGTKKLYVYREYHAGGRTVQQHADKMLLGEPRRPRAVGGAKSEQQWRDEFKAAGLPVEEPPISDVEVGIDRVYGCFARDELIIFDDLAGLLDELSSYSRELTEEGEPTEKIEDKNEYHLLDALRYIISHLRKSRPGAAVIASGKTKGWQPKLG